MRIHRLRSDNQLGFTILELLVTITVMAILSAVVLAMTAQEEKLTLLKKTAYLVAQDIREMQNLAMSGQGRNCGSNITQVFGIHFDKSGPNWNQSYVLFADCNGNDLYKSSPDKDIIIRQVTLKPELNVADISLLAGNLGSTLDVTFRPPDPIISVNTATSGQETIITLGLKSNPSKTKVIRINTVGRVQVE
ncbi:MAG: type II secretion system protein [Candidatus Pacebacteria bacterium]|nr:type II secretion system protein [Candidatus Paceibacterota bacterium]